MLCGSRFGRGLVRPGGVGFDVDATRVAEHARAARRPPSATSTSAVEALVGHAPRCWRASRTPGASSPEVADELGLVGLAARACGLERDVRKTHPAGIYPLRAHPGLDLAHRRRLRARLRALARDPALGRVRARAAARAAARARRSRVVGPLRPNQLRGLARRGLARRDLPRRAHRRAGRFARYKIVDPSFHNWIGLAMALRDQQISDFPLCNKSFNLSYCGHDL